jgi:hypothetical protein
VPRLKNPFHESLALARADGLTWGDAYKKAGGTGQERWKGDLADQILGRNPEIRSRVEEIHEERDLIRRKDYTTLETDLLLKLGTVIDRCMQNTPAKDEKNRIINTLCGSC